jgi:outer membrane protein TolC
MPISKMVQVHEITCLFVAILFMALSPSGSAKSLVLNEKMIESFLEKDLPSLDQIDIQELRAKQRLQEVEESLQAKLNTETSYLKTNERPFAVFIPVTSPIETFSAKVTKPTKYGVRLGASAFTEQTTNNFVQDGTTSGVSLDLAVDLYKDFLDRTTRSKLLASQIQSKKAGLEKQMQKDQFHIQLRRIYWTILANEESLKLAQELLETAQVQAKDARERFQNNIADKGELARYESQVFARKANILSFEHRRAQSFRQLKELIPSLGDQSIEIGDYNLDETVGKVLACTQQISSFKAPPVQFSLFAQMIELIEAEYQARDKITQVYSDWDISLIGEVQRLGKEAGGYDNSFDRWRETGRHAFNVGLKIEVPLGGESKKSEQIREEIEFKQKRMESQKLQARLKAFHSQTIESIQVLNKVIKNEGENSQKLQISLDETRKKFGQARISVNELIQDQDAYLQSNLNEIQTKLTVITTLLDYFNVFTDTPCDFNR